MNILETIKDALALLKTVLSELSNKQNLFNLLILALAVSVGAGLLLYMLDANIHSLLDGIWSAWVTMTHVGFGDVVPTSFLGRVLSAALILFGLVLFSLFTALLSANLIGKNLDAWGHDARSLEQDVNQLETEESKILKELVRLHDRLDALEKQNK
jgi:voltage-gated potassium channel